MLVAALATEIPRMRENGLLCPYVIEGADGTLLGGVALHHFDPMRDTLEVGYWLFDEARGRGVATRAVQAATDHAFANGVYRMEAHVRLGHSASERVLERLGFEREGVKRRYLAPRRGARRRDALLAARAGLGRWRLGGVSGSRRWPVEVDEAGQVRGQQRESGEHLDHRRAAGAAALREDVARAAR